LSAGDARILEEMYRNNGGLGGGSIIGYRKVNGLSNRLRSMNNRLGGLGGGQLVRSLGGLGGGQLVRSLGAYDDAFLQRNRA
jgi:hypothetical protein